MSCSNEGGTVIVWMFTGNTVDMSKFLKSWRPFSYLRGVSLDVMFTAKVRESRSSM